MKSGQLGSESMSFAAMIQWLMPFDNSLAAIQIKPQQSVKSVDIESSLMPVSTVKVIKHCIAINCINKKQNSWGLRHLTRHWRRLRSRPIRCLERLTDEFLIGSRVGAYDALFAPWDLLEIQIFRGKAMRSRRAQKVRLHCSRRQADRKKGFYLSLPSLPSPSRPQIAIDGTVRQPSSSTSWATADNGYRISRVVLILAQHVHRETREGQQSAFRSARDSL